MKLQDRVALITAAGSGMGRATAELFAREGATVVVVDLRAEAAEETCDAIRAAGGSAHAIRCDVSSVDDLTRAFAEVEQRYGILHVLFNHAGIPGAAGLEVSEADWQTSIDVNLKSAFFGTQLALPLLRRAPGKASVIFTASTTGLVGSPYSPLYSLTKGGVVLFMRSLALAVAKEGIRANAICPGPIETPMLPVFFGRETGGGPEAMEEIRGFVAAAVPMARPGQPAEIAAAALFLACDDSSFVTGVPLPVDGGYTAR